MYHNTKKVNQTVFIMMKEDVVCTIIIGNGKDNDAEVEHNSSDRCW